MSKGTIKVHTENIFPIIKRWLYSDKDIFVRELVSNGCDAVAKLKKLSSLGEATVEADSIYSVNVTVDKANKRLVFSDNGIGMTAEEIEKYINQVAFSGAEEFLEKYKEKGGDNASIIGHFGLGFYSAFMVADKVEIDTLSYQTDAKPAKWVCEGGTEYEIFDGTRTARGTDITLHISDENAEFLESFTIRQILNKYCSFLPTEIFIIDTSEEKKESDEQEAPKPINDTNPLWLKKPSECTEEEYKDFYTKVFNDFSPPLFWIHLNVDYPFNLKGILYFPKLRHELDSVEGQIKLYNNQVFVADNIKEVIPEYLMLLKGVIDCPDLPLNVSRSFLQNDGYVKKVSAHITKKVADKLTGMFNTAREEYEKYWVDINPFVKYGCLKDESFYEKVKDILIFKTTNDRYATLGEYLTDAKEKHENKVYYVTDEKQQAQYVSMFKAEGIEAVILPHMIDTHFVSFLEYKQKDTRFERIDSSVADTMKSETQGEVNAEDIIAIFKDALNDEKLKIEAQGIKNESVPAIVTLSEQSRRMKDMSAMFAGMNMPFEDELTLVVNINNPLVASLVSKKDDKELVSLVCRQVYDLAMMCHKPLEPQAMTDFVERSNTLLSKLAGV